MKEEKTKGNEEKNARKNANTTRCNAKPKIFSPAAEPFPGAQDS